MSRCSWRGAEVLYDRRRAHRAVQMREEKARFRREQVKEEWQITGEPDFKPKERSYPSGGGVDGACCDAFLRTAEEAIHLHDRGKTLTRDMSATLASLERRHKALEKACGEYCNEHSSHLHPERVDCGKWQVRQLELRLFVEAAGRMTSSQRQAFTNALAPHRNKSDGYIDRVEPLATKLQRAKKASVDQAVSGELFSVNGTRRFAREVRVASKANAHAPRNDDHDKEEG